MEETVNDLLRPIPYFHSILPVVVGFIVMVLIAAYFTLAERR